MVRTDRAREVTELHEVSGKSGQGSALQTQTWPTSACCLPGQCARTSGLSLPVPIGPLSFFHSILDRGEEVIPATHLIGCSPVPEARALVHRLQSIMIVICHVACRRRCDNAYTVHISHGMV